MKYQDFKIFKFSTISKMNNHIRDGFSRIEKNIKKVPNYVVNLFSYIIKYVFSGIYKGIKFTLRDFLKIYKYLDIRRFHFNFSTIYKYLNIGRFNLTKVTKYFDPRIYNIQRINKINFISYKFLFLHLPASVIFFGFLYLVIPTFYNYDKSSIENMVCKKHNIVCSIKGKVNYRFYPTPRIKITDVTINDFFEKKKYSHKNRANSNKAFY